MRGLFQPRSRLERLALLLALASVAGLLALATARGSWTAVAGDESTFLAMLDSLAGDGDLRFGDADAARLAAAPSDRGAVILQRAGGRIAYSKPVIFPLAAAPFYALLGRWGVVLFNALALGGALWLFWRGVRDGARDEHERGRWALTLATFAAAGALLPQFAWAMGDTLQVALALAGATLALGRDARRPGVPGAIFGGLLLGLLVVMRLPNALLAAAVVSAVWLAGRRPAALAAAGGATAGVLAALLLNLTLAGAASPYRAERATFNPATGYPAGAEADEALEQFVAGRATQTLGARPALEPRKSAYSGLYFLIGRHTGLLLYFPAAMLLFAVALRHADGAGLALLLGVLGLALFYLVWMPQNYFGGASFVGNRYFLPAYALLLPALRRPPRAAPLLAVWVFCGVLFVAAWSSVAAERGRPFSSQSHAYGGLFRLFPYESTALAIEDREDLYLSDELVRFVDRNARVVSDVGFHLIAGAPPAELLVATERTFGVLRFVAVADAPEASLIYHDWRGRQLVELRPDPAGARGTVEIVAAPAWRRHPFWWSPEVLRAHVFRLRLEAEPPGSRVQLRYLGPYRLVPKFFAYELLELELSPEPGRVAIRLRLRNSGRRPWSSAGDVPVHLGYRWSPAAADADGSAEVPTGFAELGEVVGQGEELLFAGELEAPSGPGRYRLELDLVIAGAAWFREWMEAPIAERVVEIGGAG